MSASLNETPWNSPIGRPNWRRVACPVRGELEDQAGAAGAVRRHHHPARVQPLGREVEALSLLAEDARVRHAHVGERDQVGVVAARRDAADRRDLDARQILVDEERREARTRALRRLVLAGDGDEDDVVGVIGVRDELLRPADDPVAAVADGPGLDRARVGAGARLGEREALGALAADRRQEVPLPLLPLAGEQDMRRRPTHELSAQLVRANSISARAPRDVVEPAAAELLRHVRAHRGRPRSPWP